jgi:imidazoleglycerol-phosphate dehydratase/histidinol-phosphatase
MKRALFIDRDGTLIVEPLPSRQIDSFEKLEFLPGVFTWLGRIARETDFVLVLVSNQDGLGTESFPQEKFDPPHKLMIQTLASEGIHFIAEHIDHTFEREGKDTRKPGIGMLRGYLNGEYDMAASYVIGDRPTDVEMARTLGATGIIIEPNDDKRGKLVAKSFTPEQYHEAHTWEDIYRLLRQAPRHVSHQRKTRETQISVDLNLDGTGRSEIKTGLGFMDHMLDQLARHGGIDLFLTASGDLHIDEHHTVEDIAITLGEALGMALADKRGLRRYGFTPAAWSLPMDDALAHVAVDLGGRSHLVWEAEFKREKIGEVATELFPHFFKSLCDAAKINLNIRASGDNEHHKIEAIFKGVARALRMALRRDPDSLELPSTKGAL